MDELESMYRNKVDEFLKLGLKSETKASLDEKKLEEMRKNFCKDGPPCVPGECNVLTTYIPVEPQPLVNFLSEVIDPIAELFPGGLPYYLVPPSNYHISLVMIQDFRPVDMGDEAKKTLALTEEEIVDVRHDFDQAMAERTPEKFDLHLYGILFSPIDGAIMAVFIDNGQMLKLRGQIGNSLKEFLREGLRDYKKPFIHITLLRPLAQFPSDLLKELQKKQRKYLPITDRYWTLPIRQIALGRESRWMHSEVEDFQKVTLQ